MKVVVNNLKLNEIRIIGSCVMKSFFRIIPKIFLILTILAGCESTEEIKETDPVALFYQGTAFVEKGQYDKAISDFNKAIEINPRYAEAYNNRGGAYHKKAQLDKTCSDFKRACELGLCEYYEEVKRKGDCK
jgi:tetratricopeptide (TPR) repeat protein